MPGSDDIHRGKQRWTAPLKEILHAAAAGRLLQIGLGAVLAGQESACQGKVRNDAEILADADVFQRALILVAYQQIVVRL